MTYKDALTLEMEKLAQNPKVRFIGYNLKFGSKYYGTLANISGDKIIETPVAESLMCGIAMGLALEGFLPVLCFERFDFCLTCADALFNHIGGMQKYGLVLPMIIRVCVGTDTPLDPGVQHKQDYTSMFRMYSGIKLLEIHKHVPGYIEECYKFATEFKEPIMLVERKEFYEQDYIATQL